MKRWNLVLGSAVVAIGMVWATVWARKSGAEAIRMPAAVERELRNKDIAFYQDRAGRDPLSAADRTQLAALYLQRGRETGNYEDYLRGERMARASLALRTAHNQKTFVLLASSLLSQHRFAEALDVARTLNARDPGVPNYQALLGEIEMEVGQYDSARAVFASLRWLKRDLSVGPRLARWREIEGYSAEARRMLEQARDDAASRRDLPREQVAWFSLRVGDLALRTGRLRDAERAYRDGLRASPDDYRILGAMARLAAARYHWEEAADVGDRAIAVALDPATLGVVSEAHEALGDTARAEEYARAMEVALFNQSGPFHSAWSLFLLDHGRRVEDVLARATAELRARQDIYTYDVYAWALHRANRHPEARAAMARALSQGTRDALLLYHAGMIEHALGDDDAARRWLHEALSVNRYFDPMQAAVARATVDTLERRARRP